jgi:hypothetical protein
MSAGKTEEEAKNKRQLFLEAQDMLLKWESWMKPAHRFGNHESICMMVLNPYKNLGVDLIVLL